MVQSGFRASSAAERARMCDPDSLAARRPSPEGYRAHALKVMYELQRLTRLTCFPVSGPIFAGKFQFSGHVFRAAGRGMDDEEIEVHRAADRLYSAAGR